MTANTVEVSLHGAKPVKIPLDKSVRTVNDALSAAAQLIGVNVDPDRVGKIKNGKQVNGETPVTEGDQLTTATNVANG